MSNWEVCIVLYKTYQSKVHEYEWMRHFLIYLRMSYIITKDKCVHNSGCVRFWDWNENTVLLSEQIGHWKRLIWKVYKSGRGHSNSPGITFVLKKYAPPSYYKVLGGHNFLCLSNKLRKFPYIPQYRMKQRPVQLFASSLNSHKFFFLWFLRYIDPMLYFCSILAHLSWNLKWACLIAFCSSSVCQSIRPFFWM